ncbi:TPA: hypothetical protein R4S08_005133 [Kluyvera ascorbata]|nr:hypothetical protein [Kluyvera ascorbata]
MCRDVILLKHNKKLKLKSLDSSVGFDFDSISNDQLTIYTFSSLNEKLNKKVSKEIKVDGTTRFTDKHQTDIGIVNFRSMSPFYANIIWDLAHHLEVGKKIFVIEMNECDCVLDSGYYSSAFKLIEKNNNFRVYEKTESLAIEKNSGLSSWTFGIPVGPEEPTVLNCCVARILELGIDDFEIILCGRPHRDFKYFDKVKIVGEEITAPPVHITRKKNEIVRNATKDNLCILHDRVFLPKDFIKAINRFGDMFPFVGFQSIYFADYNNLIPRRYSDFNVVSNKFNIAQSDNKIQKDTLFYEFVRNGCAYQHCLRADFGRQYLTGSLYICKRSLWEYCPQNEDYYWEEFEDAEFGVRASNKGIPCSINPYAFTQSINARSILHFFGCITTKTIVGTNKAVRSFSEIIPFLRRKPIFRITQDIAKIKILQFARKYNVDTNIVHIINSAYLNGNERYRLVFEVVMKSKIENWNIDSYVNDFFTMLLHEDINVSFKKNIANVCRNEVNAYNKKIILLKHAFVLNQLSNSFHQNPFISSPDDIFVKKEKISKTMSFITAVCLKYFSRSLFFKLSISELTKMIIDTTPSRD